MTYAKATLSLGYYYLGRTSTSLMHSKLFRGMTTANGAGIQNTNGADLQNIQKLQGNSGHS